jgi:phosphoglycerol transferase MdoB-like AlkP superfamily enzyme
MSNISYLVAHGEKRTTQTILPYASGAIVCLISLYICKVFFDINTYSVGLILVVTGFTVCTINLFSAKKMIRIQFDRPHFFKILIVSVPILATLFFSVTESSLIKLFVLSCISGFLCIGSLAYIKKNVV